MLFGKKKESAIDRRLREIEKEMTRVGGELKSVTRPKAEPVAPKIPAAAGNIAARPPLGSDNGFVPSKPKESLPEGDLFAHASRTLGGKDESDLFAQSDDARQTVRERFANYFMAGHFPNLRPPRQQRRIIRNKAIIMMIVVLAIVFWLVYFLQTH